MFDNMYAVRESDIEPFGTNWCYRGLTFEHGKKTLIAKYPAGNEDGADVRVYCIAMPARGHELEVAGATKYTVGFGTSVAPLVAEIAHEISEGMIDVKPATALDPDIYGRMRDQLAECEEVMESLRAVMLDPERVAAKPMGWRTIQEALELVYGNVLDLNMAVDNYEDPPPTRKEN